MFAVATTLFFSIVQFNINKIKLPPRHYPKRQRRIVKLFYENLQRICDEKKIPVTNLIAELGLSSGNLSSWKKGNNPRSDTLIKLSNKLGVSVNYLLENDSTNPKELLYARYSALSLENQKIIDEMMQVLKKNQ